MLRLGILGYPLHHTLSPVLHGFLLERMGLEGVYDCYETPPEALAGRFSELRAGGLRGLNVTIPHKVAITAMLDRLHPSAEAIGSVNTVVFEPSGSVGLNTDVSGFLRSLPGEIRDSLPERPTLMIGAGGAARAVLAALLPAGTPGLTIAVRSAGKTDALVELAARLRPDAAVHVVELADLTDLSGFGLVVQTTPVGMAPAVSEAPFPLQRLADLPDDAFVYDLIYRPEETLLLHAARCAGLRTQAGLEMLVYQGVESFEQWAGRPVPVAIAEGALARLREELAVSAHP